MTRTLEICGFPTSDFDACQRVLAEGEACPEHSTSEGVTVEYEPDIEWMIDEEEIVL